MGKEEKREERRRGKRGRDNREGVSEYAKPLACNQQVTVFCSLTKGAARDRGGSPTQAPHTGVKIFRKNSKKNIKHLGTRLYLMDIKEHMHGEIIHQPDPPQRSCS
jgi:hypothetical protein